MRYAIEVVAQDRIERWELDARRGSTFDVTDDEYRLAKALLVCREAHMANCLAKDKIAAAWHAACAFIDSHVADPDLTSEMILKYEAFKRWREVIKNA